MLIDSALLATALGAPLAAVAAAATAPDRADEATARTAGALGVGAVAAVALGVSTTVGSAARLGPLEVDPFAALVLVLVLGMGATVKDLYPAESEEVLLPLPNAPDTVKDGTDPVFAVVSPPASVLECRPNNNKTEGSGVCP